MAAPSIVRRAAAARAGGRTQERGVAVSAGRRRRRTTGAGLPGHRSQAATDADAALQRAYGGVAPEAVWGDVFETAYQLDNVTAPGTSAQGRSRTMTARRRRPGSRGKRGSGHARAAQHHANLAELTAQELRLIAEIKKTQAALEGLALTGECGGTVLPGPMTPTHSRARAWFMLRVAGRRCVPTAVSHSGARLVGGSLNPVLPA